MRHAALVPALATMLLAGSDGSALAPEPPPGPHVDALITPDLADVRVDLTGRWLWHLEVEGDEALAAPGHDDSHWPAVAVPGNLEVDVKKGVLWLRRKVDLKGSAKGLGLRIGTLAGEAAVYVNGVDVGVDPAQPGPILVRRPGLRSGPNVIAVRLAFKGSKRGMWWGGAPAIGLLGLRRRVGFFSMQLGWRVVEPRGAGVAPDFGLYVPRSLAGRVDPGSRRTIPLVVALHGWGGSIFSLLPYGILELAEKHAAVVVFPYGAKTLYIGDAEERIVKAMDEVTDALPIDRDRIGLVGVSMGGAGALGVGFHYPDRFSAVVSYFGDSYYDLKRYPYLRKVLKKKHDVDRASVLNVPENARHLPVFLIHGRGDTVCDVDQSEALYESLTEIGFDVRFEDPPAEGHSVRLVARFLPEVIGFLTAARRAHAPARVSYGKNDDHYAGAWWLRYGLREHGRFGHVDVELHPASAEIEVHRAEGARELRLALATAPKPTSGKWRRLRARTKEAIAVRVPVAAVTGKPRGVAGTVTREGADWVLAVPAGESVWELR